MKMCKLYLSFLVLIVLVTKTYQTYLPTTTVGPIPIKEIKVVPEDVVENVSYFGIKSTINHCMRQKDMLKCMKKYLLKVLDKAVLNTEDWQLNEFMLFKKNPDFVLTEVIEDNGRSFEDIMQHKLKSLFDSRVFQFSFWNKDANLNEEARKKKDKHMMNQGGGVMMMSGVAVMAMLAQMFLGKVAFLAGSALLIAKIALLFSTLSALKKSLGGGSTSGSEHVVYSAGDVGKQSYGGWQRSIQQASLANLGAEDLAYRAQQQINVPSYDGL